MTALVWFKRDLRLADHPALDAALAPGPAVLVYILEPGLWQQPDASARHYLFIRDSLRALRAACHDRGADLVIRVGDAVPVLRELVRQTGAKTLFSHEETGNAWSFERDRAVAVWAREAGITWHEYAQCGVQRRLRDRDHWAASRNRHMADAIVPTPRALPPHAIASDPVPDAAFFALTDACKDGQTGGRAEAKALLDSFLHTRGQTYRRAMSSPGQGALHCTRLSPHLAFGTLSVREAVQATADRQRAVKGARDGWPASLKSVQSRFAWRDHFMQKLEDEPQIEWRAMHRAYEGLRPTPPDADRLQAWRTGDTGLPFVDACMRSLIATGWLNFRMRSMLMAVASYHLWLPWQVTGRHLARMFTDYEPGIHWSQCQMQSGTTGINTLRIYNPVKQGCDQDPTGAFTRQWVPELRSVPDALLQEPWRWDGPTGYRPPIVDVKTAAKAAKDAIWSVRQGTGFRSESARVVQKHASRKDPQRHFVNDRAAKRSAKPVDTRQQSFDF